MRLVSSWSAVLRQAWSARLMLLAAILRGTVDRAREAMVYELIVAARKT